MRKLFTLLFLALVFIVIAFYVGRYSKEKEVERLKVENERINLILKTSNC